MKLACANLMVPGKNLTEKANKLRAWGFDGISVFIQYDEWNEALNEELMTLEERTGVVPCEFVLTGSSYGHLMDADAEMRKKARAMYIKTAKICAKIGAVTELEFEYGPQDPLPLFEPYQKMSEREEQVFLAVYKEIANEIVGTNAYVLIENINRYESPYLNCLSHCQEIVNKLNIPNTGILADFFHMSIEENDLPEAIRNCGNLIKHVHLGDSNRLLPGYGRTDWKACFEALKDIGYEGYLSLECCTCGDPAITLQECAVFLKKLMNKHD